MNPIRTILIPFFKKGYNLSLQIQRRFRKLKLKWQAAWHGGTMEMAPSVCLDHPVVFMGAGKLILEEKVVLGYPLSGSNTLPIQFQPRERTACIQIGRETVVVNRCEFLSRSLIVIGPYCRIGARVSFLDADFHGLKPMERIQPGLTAPIVIEENVWIGAEAMILKGIHIGRDAVIGARSAVTKDVPAGANRG